MSAARRRHAFTLAACLLATGIDVRAQDITTEPDVALEGVGVTCIALTIFAEAPTGSWLEQALIARAILNRQAELPLGADACDVVQQPGYSAALEAWTYPRKPFDIDARAWQQAIDVTLTVIADDYDFPSACIGATQFTSASTAPARPPTCLVGALTFSSTGLRP